MAKTEYSIKASPEEVEVEATAEDPTEIKVTVDGKDDRNDFKVHNPNEWIDIVRTRSSLKLYFSEYFGTEDREGEILLEHKAMSVSDEGKTISVKCRQKKREYDISLSRTNVTLNCDNGVENGKYGVQTVKITVTCKEGCEDFAVKAYKKFSSDGGIMEYDNPFGISREVDGSGNKLLVITNYGQIPLDNTQYYEIVLAHRNDISKTATLHVEFDKGCGEKKIEAEII